MNSSNFRFSLDLHSLHSQVTIPAFHGDTSITLYITLTDGGKPYYFAQGSLAKITIKRPTGTFLEDFCMLKDNITIVYPFAQNEGTCAVEGINECDITVYAPNGAVVGSPRFTIMVAEKVMRREDIIIADEDYKIAESMIKAEAARQAAEAERVDAEDARVLAEQNRATAEQRRASEEAARALAEAARVEAELDRADAEGARVAADRERDAAVEEVARIVLSSEASASTLDSTVEATAEVSLVGEGENRKFHFAFGIPQGKTGDTGPQGVQGIPGIQGPQGKPFGLAKIYPSEDAMFADFGNADIAVGDFVMINTGDVEDEENSRIYVKTEDKYSYVTDMSGATGIQGPSGPQGIPGNQGLPGKDGKDGEVPIIGANGNWWFGGLDSGVRASADAPTFNLVALGLPTVPMDGTMVNAEIDTTDIMAALDKGAIKIIAAFGMGASTVTAEVVMGGIHVGAMGVYICSYPFDFEGMKLMFNLVVGDGAIGAYYTDLSGGGASGLPEVTTEDEGKFLRVVNGAWSAVSLTDVSTEGA